MLAGYGGLSLYSQHFGRPRWVDYLRSGDRDHPGQHSETLSLLKLQKISWAWWFVPVVPATWEAEAGELPEPSRRRLRWAENTPLHSSLGNKRNSVSKKKKLAWLVAGACNPGRLRQENLLNLGGGSCSELRSSHCTPAWMTEQDSV